MNEQPDTRAVIAAPSSAAGKGVCRHSVWWATSLLLSGLIITALAAHFTKAEVDAVAKREFDFACNEIRVKILDRLSAHEQILRSGAAYYEDSDGITRDEWHRFTDRQKVSQQLPGIQGIGFALLIPRQQLAQHIQEIRAEGFSQYCIRPTGERETYSSIIYLEPFADRNLRAFGYDMLTEPVRREAMERARDQDTAALSGRVVLVQETDKDVQAGTLMYVPVYHAGMPYATVAERRAAIWGWVYSPYRMNDLMSGVLGSRTLETDSRVRLEVFDGEQVSPESLLYDSQSAGGKERVPASVLALQTPVESAGRRWTLCFTPSGNLTAAVDYGKVWLELLGGTSISLLLFGLSLSLLNTRLRARQIAEKLTAEYKRMEDALRQATDRLSLAVRAGGVGIWDYDVANNGLVWDDEMFRLYGITRDQFGGAYEAWQAGVHPEDRQRGDEEIQLALRGEKDFNTTFRVAWPDGTIHYIRALALVQRTASGQPVRMVGTNWDITALKKAEETLRESEENFRTCFNTIGDMMAVVAPSGRLLHGNTALLHKLGYSPHEVLDLGVLDLHPADIRREVTEIFAAMFRGERNSCPLPWITKNGTLVPVETRVWPGKWNGQDCLFGLGKDLSAEQEAQQRFERLFRNNPALMALSVLSDRTFTDVNDAFLAKTGYTRDEILGNTATELALFVHREQQATVADELQANGRITDFEVQVRRKDGTVLDGLFSGEVISSQGRQYYLTVMIDITDRKKAESLLRLTQFSVDHSGEMVFWITRDGFLTYANDATCEQLGYTRDELQTMTMFAIHPEWPRERYIDDLRLLRSAGSFTFECMYRRKDGQLFPAEVTITDLDRDPQICYCIFARNVTERKRVLSELTVAKQSADSAAQAKVQFLANMSHEIRTPMTAIAGYLDLITRSREKLPENCREWVTRARRSVSHLLALLNDILDLAKVDSNQMSLHCDLHSIVELIDEVCAFFLPQTREKLLRLTVNYSTAMPSVAFTDSTRLRQILINVIGNAVKFTETGSVAVEVSVAPLPDTETPWLRVTVTDTGMGVPAEKLSQLFAPFTQLHDLRACRYGGTGLGLDISRRLARQFGGDITADSTEGEGSVFTTTLPIVIPPSAHWLPAVELQHVARTYPDNVLPAHDFSGKHILVVDDNPDNQSILRFLLADTNATITVAEDGRAGVCAVLAAAKTASPFDLVLMDMRMPVMDGYVATKRLREVGVRTPIIALTASVMRGDEDKCRQAGCDAYLSKPIIPAQLLATIAKFILTPTDIRGPLAASFISRSSVNLAEIARFAPLLAKYVRDLPNVMTALRTTFEAGDMHDVRAIAHRTRGTAENYGFPEITRAAGLLEDTIDEEASHEEVAACMDAVLCLMQSALTRHKEDVAAHVDVQSGS